MKGRRLWVLVVTLVVVGVVVTIQDYRNWTKAEWENYGHGYEDNRSPAETLSKFFENRWVGVRLKYPQDWEVVELRGVRYEGDSLQLSGVWGRQVVVAKIGGMVSVIGEKTKQGFGENVEAERKYIGLRGSLLREIEGLELETADGVIATWVENIDGVEVVFQEGLVQKGERLIRVRAEVRKSDWPNYEKTFLGMFRLIVVI